MRGRGEGAEGVLQGQPGSLASLPPACLMKRTPVGFIIKELQLTDGEDRAMRRWGTATRRGVWEEETDINGLFCP